ncbi:hypothetical protein LINPERHAP2_LOCUS33251, partial [Linum perenne]
SSNLSSTSSATYNDNRRIKGNKEDHHTEEEQIRTEKPNSDDSGEASISWIFNFKLRALRGGRMASRSL